VAGNERAAGHQDVGLGAASVNGTSFGAIRLSSNMNHQCMRACLCGARLLMHCRLCAYAQFHAARAFYACWLRLFSLHCTLLTALHAALLAPLPLSRLRVCRAFYAYRLTAAGRRGGRGTTCGGVSKTNAAGGISVA